MLASIRNIALNAAFFAAEANGPIGMGHLQRAAHLDAAKRERPIEHFARRVVV